MTTFKKPTMIESAVQKAKFEYSTYTKVREFPIRKLRKISPEELMTLLLVVEFVVETNFQSI